MPCDHSHSSRRIAHAGALESSRSPCLLLTDTCDRGTKRAAWPKQSILQQIPWQRRTKGGQHNGTSVLWRKRQRTHLEIVSSHELFAHRLPSSAGTLHSVSTSRRCSSGALLQLQVQLTALAVLQLQRTERPSV